MKLSNVRVNPKAVEDGDWVKNLPEMDDLELKVRGQNSSAWKVLRRKLINALPRNIRNRPDGLPQQTEDALVDKLLVGAGLLDWKNLELDDGVKPYSKELAEKLIKDPEWALFREAILTATVRVGTEVAEADEALSGNSVTSSSGNSATEGAQAG